MTASIIDLDAALERLGGDRELLNELMQFFLEDSPGLLDQVRQGIGNGQAEPTERAAHSLKGLAANFGAQEAVRASQAIEQLGRNGDLAQAAAAVPRLEREISALQQALTVYRQNSLSALRTLLSPVAQPPRHPVGRRTRPVGR